MPVAAKPSTTVAQQTSGALPDLPNWAPGIIEVPGAQETNQRLQEWWQTLKYRLLTTQDENTKSLFRISASINTADGSLAAEIEEERIVRATEDEALASSITSLSAAVSTNYTDLSAAITNEQTVRANADTAIALSVTNLTSTVSTNLSTVNASIASEASTRASADTAIAATVTSLTSTVSTNYTTLDAAITSEASTRASADTAISATVTTLTSTVTTNNTTLTTSISTEASTRATADGHLSGKYTLTVAAGDVVTGMNITSSTDGGTNVSHVRFVAANFQIYDGTATSYPVFETSTGVVKLAGTLTVNTSGKVFIGAGNYGNADTGFYVDSSGQFSLKDKLTWNGSTLSVNGAITSTSGTIGGFALASNKLSAGSGDTYIELNASAGSGIVLGGGSSHRLEASNNGIGGMRVRWVNSLGVSVINLVSSPVGTDFGLLNITNESASQYVELHGGTGDITCTGFTNIGNMANALPGNLCLAGGSGVNNGIQFNGATNAISFYWDAGAGHVKVYVDGTLQVMQ